MRLRGVPFSVRAADILAFFRDYEIFENSVKIGENANKMKTGEAAVLFPTEQECKRAF